MSSQAQINANRLNSKKSTGPTSPEGKAASSLNALKSGIHARSHIIPGEDPAELEALTAAFLLHHHPADPNQLALVDTLIAAEWTQRRLRRIEAGLWNSRDESVDSTYAEISNSPNPTEFPPLGHSFPDALDPFLRIQRRIDGTNRLYLRTLQVLQNLQKSTVEQAPACPTGINTGTLTPAIGSVPPFTPPRGNEPLVSRENPKSSRSESLETG